MGVIMGSEKTEQGPTWADVYNMIDWIESTYCVTVRLSMRLFMHKGKFGGDPYLVGQMVAHAHWPLRIVHGSFARYSYGFRGRSGARTASAAFHMALVGLIDELEDRSHEFTGFGAYDRVEVVPLD